jgi:hypothetical protein
MPENSGFTKKEHFWMGNKLGALDRELNEALIEVEYAYGKTAKQTKHLRHASNALIKARELFYDVACEAFPHDTEMVKAYYGNYQLMKPDERPAHAIPVDMIDEQVR